MGDRDLRGDYVSSVYSLLQSKRGVGLTHSEEVFVFFYKHGRNKKSLTRSNITRNCMWDVETEQSVLLVSEYHSSVYTSQ